MLRELNAGHSQLVKRLNKEHAQLQAKEQEEMNEKEHEETGKVCTVVGDVLVIGIGNYDSVTKKQCITELETLINVRDNTKQTLPKPLVNAEYGTNNMPLEPTLVDANDDANKNECSPLLRELQVKYQELLLKTVYTKTCTRKLIPLVYFKMLSENSKQRIKD